MISTLLPIKQNLTFCKSFGFRPCQTMVAEICLSFIYILEAAKMQTKFCKKRFQTIKKKTRTCHRPIYLQCHWGWGNEKYANSILYNAVTSYKTKNMELKKTSNFKIIMFRISNCQGVAKRYKYIGIILQKAKVFFILLLVHA